MKLTQDHISRSLSTYLNNFKHQFSKSQFNHFRSRILSILNNQPHGAQTARNYSGTHASNETRFLDQSPWNEYQLTDLRISHAFQIFNQNFFKYVNIVVDDSTSEREYATQLPSLRLHHKSDDGNEIVEGQTYVTTHLVLGEYDFPLYADIYNIEEDGKTKIDLANEQVQKAIEKIKPLLRPNHQVIVVSDSWYNGEPFLKTTLAHANVIAALKTNRNLKYQGKWIKIKSLADKISKYNYNKESVAGRQYRFIRLEAGVKGFGNEPFTILVYQQLEKTDTGEYKWSKIRFLLSTDPSIGAFSCFYIYQKRCKIETFYQFAKHGLGMDKNRSFTVRALLRFVQLVSVVYTYLNLARYELTPLQI